MRWDRLFADLEGQLDAADAAELAADVEDRTRHALGAVTLGQRLLASVGTALTIGTGAPDLPTARGTVTGVGPDWVLLDATDHAAVPGSGPDVLLAIAAIGWVHGLGRRADVADRGQVWSRLGLRSALRGIVQDRAAVVVSTTTGACSGTLDRVGADHVDLAVHALDEPRRAAAVRGVRTIPIGALVAVSRR